MTLQPEDCEFLTQANRNYLIAIITVSLFIAALVLRPFVSRACAQFELNEEAKARGQTGEAFALRVTLNLIGFCFHSILGPYAAYHSLQHIGEDAATTITVGSSTVSVSSCAFCWEAGVSGTVFAGYAIWQSLQMIPAIGWEEINGENFVHHFCFSLIAVTQCNYYFAAEIVIVAVAMEISTPPLLAMLTFRQLRGYDNATFYSKTSFVVLFLVFRVCIFGLAVWHFVSMSFLRPEIIDKLVLVYVPKFVLVGTQLLYVAGWCLQVYWAVTLTMKALRPPREKHLTKSKQPLLS